MKAVYVASAGERRQKIGISSNPQRRVARLSGAAGCPLVLATHHEVSDAGAVERMAHWLLREVHVYGEWFDIDVRTANEAVIQAAKMIEDGGRAPPRAGRPNSGRGGRPPLFNKPTQVRLSPETMAEIDALVGKRRRAAFIRDAVESQLQRERHKRREGAE